MFRSFVCSLSVLLGCSLAYQDDLDKQQCTVDADCTSTVALGLVCLDSICQATPCTPGCGSGSSCVAGSCAADSAPRCVQDTDCDPGERCGYNGVCYSKWGCVAGPSDWPAVSAPFQVKTLLRRIDTNINDLSTVGGVNVIACVAEDPLCNAPVLRSSATTLDANKLLTVNFEGISSAGFIGSLKLTPTLADAYLPTFVQVPAVTPWVADYATEKATYLGSAATSDLLESFVGVQVDPDSVLAGFFLYDCGGRPASGVQIVTTTGSNSPFFPVGPGNIPMVGQKATTDEGVGFVINLPGNKLAVFELRDPDTQAMLGPSISFVAGAGGLNFVHYYPRYSAVKAWMANYRRQSSK